MVNKVDVNSFFKPGQSLEQPDVFSRMLHIFFGKIVEMKAPMENKGGSSAAMNMNKVQKAASVLKRFLTIQYSNSAASMPAYTSNFAFTSVETVKSFVWWKTVQNDQVMQFVSGATYF